MIGFILICGGMLFALAILFSVASSQDQRHKRETECLMAMYKAKEKSKNQEEEKR